MTTVVIGGKAGSPRDGYMSPSDVAAFLRGMGGRKRHDPSIQIGHVIDHFVGSNVFHFPAIDAAEVSLEAREGRQRTGEAVAVPPDELQKRATALVADPIFRKARFIG